MKIEINEFIEQVKDEITCYEELGENGAEKWEVEFNSWLKNNSKNKSDSICSEKGNMFYIASDESDIMEIADSYYDAVLEGNVSNYWKTFS